MPQPLQKIIASRYGGRNLPVTLVLPDGGRVPLSSEPEVEILARTWRGLKALAAPAMGALARAYVHNDIDFTGSARRATAIAEGDGRRDRARPRLADRRAGESGGTSTAATARTSATTTTSPTRSTACGSTRRWSTRARTSRRDDDDARRRAGGQARPHLPQAAPGARASAFSTSAAAGARFSFTRRSATACEATGITLSKNQFEHVKGEIAARGLAGRVRRRVARLPRPAGGHALRQDRERRHVRARRHRARSRSTSARSGAS